MSHADRRRRLPALAASAAMVAALLPLSAGTATAATAVPRSTAEGCPEGRMPSAGFNDTSGRFGEREIDCVAWYGVAQGTQGGDYAPNGRVTRAAMAKFLVNLLNAADVLLDPTPPDAFSDDDGTAFELEINQLAQLNIVRGSQDSNDVDGDGNTDERLYFPQNLVTRAQMASFINETHGAITGVKISSADDFFTDDNGTFHESNINAIASVGIAAGTSATEYSGELSITRGQMAVFLAREIDYLVEQGFLDPPINGNADIILDQREVQQGRAVTGRIVTEGDVGVSSGQVDICGVAQDVNMNVDNSGQDPTFSFTLPFETPAGQSCRLDFDIRLANNDRELESRTITVLETEKILDGPELVSIAIQSVGTDQVTIRYEFNETINPAVEASKFRLYGFGATQFTASQATKTGDASVVATFTRAQYDDATTGGLDRFAVQDLDGKSNAEFGFGLKSKSLKEGETAFPDLLTVTGSGNTLTFTFDAPAYGVQPSDFGAVYHVNGQTSSVDGQAIANGGDGATTFTVTFTPPEGGSVLRGFVKANAITGAPEGEADNARQAADVVGANQAVSPHLTSVILDPANNQVQLVFSEAVTSNAQAASNPCMGIPLPVGCQSTPARGAKIYDINGDEYFTSNVVDGSPNTLIATFAAGQVTGLIQGASIDQNLARAQRNSDLLSGVDEEGRKNTFEEGRTAAPDLTGVQRVTDANGDLRFVYTFDQAVTLTGSNTGNLYIYAKDNSFKSLEDISSNGCEENGVEVVCIVEQDSPDFAFAASARYASASWSVVSTGGDSPKFNPEGGFEIGG